MTPFFLGNIPGCYILIFGGKLMVKGKPFAGCRDAMMVVEVVRRQLRKGRKAWWQFWK